MGAVRGGRRRGTRLVTRNAERGSVPCSGNLVPKQGTGTTRDDGRYAGGTAIGSSSRVQAEQEPLTSRRIGSGAGGRRPSRPWMPAAPPPATSGSFSPFSRQPPSSLQPAVRKGGAAAARGRDARPGAAQARGGVLRSRSRRTWEAAVRLARASTAGLQDYRREFAGAAA